MNSNESQIDGKLSWNRELLENFKEEFVNRIILRYTEELLKKFQEKNEIIDSITLEKIESYVRILFFRLMASLITGLSKSELQSIYPGELYNDPPDLALIPGFNSINYLEITHDIIFEVKKKFPTFKELPPHYLGLIYEEIQDLYLKVTPSKSEIEKNEREGNYSSEKQQIFLDKNNISRKRFGSFYTPHYISKYIVKHSIEPILEEKFNYILNNREIGTELLLNDCLNEILRINILDPAMGVGFFLKDAVNYILEKLLMKINIQTKKQEENSINTKELKKFIYANVIFGIDLDPFAVELTKLIVWLSFHPNNQFEKDDFAFINNNFKHGNSLLTSLEEIFNNPEIKFNIIIGNPPYGALFSSEEKKKLKRLYKTTSRDSSAYLLEMCIKNSRYSVGVIVPKSIAFYSSWASIRKFIIDNTKIMRIADPGIAFRHVTFEELILILKTKGNDKPEKRDEIERKFVTIDIFNDLKQAMNNKEISWSGTIPFSFIKEDNELLFRPLTDFELELLKKINKNSIKIKDLKRVVTRGLYIPDSEKQNILGDPFDYLYEENQNENRKEKQKPEKFNFINYINKVPDVGRYEIKKIYHIPIKLLKDSKYLRKIEKIFTSKIFIKVLRGKRIISYPDTKGTIIPTEKLVCLIIKQEDYSLNYICAVLNSKIASWYIQKTLFSDITETSRVMDDIYLRKIPIPKINFNGHNSIFYKELTGLFTKKGYEEIYQKIKISGENSAEIHDFIGYLVDNLLTEEFNKDSIQFKAVNDLSEKIISILYGLDENEYIYISKYFERTKSS